MSNGTSKSKIVTVSLRIADVQNDPYFFKLPGEVKEPNAIKDVVLKKYFSNSGIMEGIIDGERLILQWYPENVDKNAESLHQEAIELSKRKQHDLAIMKWKKALSMNDEDVEYLYRLGLVHFEIKNYQESIEYLEKAVDICPIHYRTHLLCGINWIKLRKIDKAEIHVLESNRLNRSNILTYLNLGAIYSVQRRYNEAIDMFNSTIQIAPKESRAYLGLARIYNMLNDIEASNSYFKKVIELSPGTQMAEYAKRAIQVSSTDESVDNKEENREERFAKGMGHYLSGNYHESANQYKKYLNTHPSDDYAWYLMGEAKIRTGELDMACDCFKRAVRLNSKRGIYYKSLGITLHYQGKSKEVIEVLKKAIEMGKKDSLTWTLQGVNLMRQRKFEDAINLFKLAMNKNPNNPMAMYYLALSYIQIEENDSAVELLHNILNFEYYVPIKGQAKKLIQNLK